jgi:hypothetical protein
MPVYPGALKWAVTTLGEEQVANGIAPSIDS